MYRYLLLFLVTISVLYSHESGMQVGTFTEIVSIIGIIGLMVLYKYFLRHKHDLELKKSEKSFKMLMESTIEGIIIFDAYGNCLKCNKVAAEMFGYRVKEMTGIHASKLICEESLHLVKEKMKVYNQSPYEAQVRRKDGSCFSGLLRGRNIFYNGRKIRVSTVIDISEIKQLQYDLEALNSNLEEKVAQQVEDIRQKDQMLLHQSKLASMGEMIGAIAHQWRQPLNALNINIQNLDDDFEDGLVDKDFIDKFIYHNSQIIQFMSKTIDDFRNFYRIDKVKECFSVKETIRTTTSMQSAKLKHYNIDLQITGDDICVTGYKQEFQQVILNIVNNAIDAIIKNRILDGRIEIILEKRVVKIIDNGGGIDDNIINRIFEPYFTTKEQGEGTGIGLYMSKIIIEKNLGGKLEVKNQKNGTEFMITLSGLCRLSLPGEKSEIQICPAMAEAI